jgi:hypothetical protein
MSRRVRIGGVAALVAVLGTGAYFLAGHRVPAGQPPMVSLDSTSMAALRTDFNAAAGQVRVILLLSPT